MRVRDSEAETATAQQAHERFFGVHPRKDEDEDDDLPMLESNRASCGTPREPFGLLSTVDEPVDRLSDCGPEGQVHVWVYEARQLAAPCTVTDAVYDQYRLCIRCTLLGAVQQSSCNRSGTKSNPVWRQAQNETRDGKCGHFTWTLGQPEEGASNQVSIEGQVSECELTIDIVCGNRVVTSANVPLDELLVASKSTASGVSRLGSHWLPLAQNTGLLNISLEFASRDASCCQDLVPRRDGTIVAKSEATHYNTEMVVHQRKKGVDSRDLVPTSRTVPWHSPLDTRAQSSNPLDDIIVSKTGGVTLYIPTQGKKSVAVKEKTVKTRPRAPTSTSDDQMEKQLRDLYHFGISDKASECRDSDTMSVTSDFSTLSCDHSNPSLYSRQASTCASDVLVYNELIQDMESVLKCTEESTSRLSTNSTTDHKDKSSAFSKFHLKPRRSSGRKLNLTKPFDRIHSLWHGAKGRSSISSAEDNSRRKRDSCVSSTMTSPVPPSPVDEPGVVLFDSQNVPDSIPLQRSTSRDHVHEAATKAERVAAAGPRRRSLPVNTFSLEYRQEMLLQHQRKRAQRQQIEAQLLKSSLLAKIDPPLLTNGRSESLHSLTDVNLSRSRDVRGGTTLSTESSDNCAIQKSATTRTSARRHSGSNVVHINGAPLCVGKLINVGNVPGVVRYIGTTRFATGTWVGIELCEQKGKHNGTVDGHKYFSCAPDHGIFLRASRLELSAQ